MRYLRAALIAIPLIWTFTTLPASAVIVAGTSGTGNNNDTQAGLDSYLASASHDDFGYWDNLVRVSNASGVYLGYNSSTLRGWVLSANHISPEPVTITVDGSSYTVVGSGTQVGSSDLILYEIGDGISTPSLPMVPLANMPATPGEFLIMTGRAYTNDGTAPYAWVDPGTSEVNGNRWATNTVEGLAIVGGQPYIYVDFDASGDPGVTAFDGQGALGDSGGGIFILREGQWELSGTAHFVDDGPDFRELVATGDNTTNPSQPGDFTAYSDVFSHLSEINTITGTLIPEPSTISLTGLVFLLLIHQRQR